MCDKLVGDYLFFLQLVPDWFVTKQQVGIWYDDNYVYNDNEMIEWYEGYKKRKAQKATIKEKLMPISWHGEDEKKRDRKIVGIDIGLFLSDDWIKKFFDLKRTKIKMSSVMPLSFNAVELCVVTIDEKPCTHAREVFRALEYGRATKVADIAKHLCSRENYT